MSISRRDFFKRSLVAGAGAAAATMIGPFALEAEAKKGKVRIPKARRVIVMTFDGIRVDGLAKARTPNIDTLIAEGSASYLTRDVMPSITLPNSLVIIANQVFSACTGLTDIYFEGTGEEWERLTSRFDLGLDDAKTTIHFQ